MTAYEMPEIRKKVSQSILRIFDKPFRIDDLAKAVSQALEQNSPDGTLKGISVLFVHKHFFSAARSAKRTVLKKVISRYTQVASRQKNIQAHYLGINFLIK